MNGHRLPPSPSHTATVLHELQLHGYRPGSDEPDPRPLPDARQLAGAIDDLFDALAGSLQETRIEPDLEDLLWSLVNIFHRSALRTGDELDGNEQDQKRLQQEQDGSEIRSVELERATAEGISLVERRDVFEFMRDRAADLFEIHTGSTWRPRTGSMLHHKALTASLIDSRDFLAARERAETQTLLPEGAKIAFTGGNSCNDVTAIWAALDRVHNKHPDMVLLHGGSPKGAERIASCWARQRKVTEIAFKPDWNRHAKAAPFRRNDAMLEILPIGVIVFPGTGIQDNLADKAQKLGIPVMDFRGKEA